MRTAWLLALVVVCACDKSERKRVEGAAVDDAAAKEQQKAASGLVLRVGDQSTAMKTVLLVEEPQADPAKRSRTIEVYDVAADQFVCGAMRLYKPRAIVKIGVRVPFEPRTVVGGDKAWLYKSSPLHRDDAEAAETIEVRIDTVDREARTASGNLAVAVGDATLAGPFEAKLCPTRIESRDKAKPIHGMEWTTDAVPAVSIPSEPAQGFVVDGPFPIAHANARPWQKDGKDMWRLTFFRDKPDQPCAHRHDGFTRKGKDGPIERTGTASDWFAVSGPASDFRPNKPVTSRMLRDHTSGSLRASAGWMEPGNENGASFAQYGNVSLTIESATDEQMKGRIYMALPYDPKPLLVGSFEAVVCDD